MAAPFNLNYKFNADLREVPEDRASMQAYIDFVLKELKKLQPDQIRLSVKFLGEVGSYARILGKNEVALQCLSKSLDLINENDLGLRLWAVHSIRYGEVLRAQKDELGAETAFRSVLEMCRRHQDISDLSDFALQHLGKLKIDQRQYKEAQGLLEESLKIRKQKGVKELIDSSELALRVLAMRRDSRG